MIKHNFDELYFDSLADWHLFCKEVKGTIPVYEWTGKYRLIVTEVTKIGDHGAVALGSGRNAVTSYRTPNGVLKHHWEAFYSHQDGFNRKYWTFNSDAELPPKIEREGNFWLKGWVALSTLGLYKAVTQDAIGDRV